VQYQKPVILQEQKLKMSPQLYQSIQLMALPIQELKFRIQEELERNPALELVEEKGELSLEAESEDGDPGKGEEYDYFENSSDPGYTGRPNEDASNAKHNFIEGALSRPESLHDHLLWQLRLQPIPRDWFEVGELIIQNLDENGFHREDPKNVIKGREFHHLDEVIRIIQTFEPLGVCAKDYRESLIVQTRLSAEAPKRTEELLRDHLPLLEKGKDREIRKSMGLDQEEYDEIINFIRSLNPFPGSVYSTEQPTYVVPDLMLKMQDGEFVLILNDEIIPVLGVNSFFTDLMNKKKKEKEADVRHYVNEKVRDAKWFIRSINQRNETLIKIGRAIVEFQRDFFIKGPKYLVPLTLKDIASEVGVHETTVSRISNAKYLQTEWGIYPLKYFFSNSISGAGSTGSRFSKEGVKERIREIIENNTTDKKLSDQKISDILKSRGIDLARRTVAKYRKELDIAPSYER
jgi:RNA polymerase sigma-54 factor